MQDYSKLTSREIEVLSLMAKAFDNKEIAKTLFIEVTTVKTFIDHIYSKLGLTNSIGQVPRVCAVLYYLNHKEDLTQ